MKKVFQSILLVLVFSTNVMAERTGRLRDGRAYRIDEKGYKLVDQLAEYEVKLRELKTQLYALEDELKEKNSLISSYKNKAQIELKEQDLLKKKKPTKVKTKIVYKEKIVEKECPEPKIVKEEVVKEVIKEKDCPVADDVSCPDQVLLTSLKKDQASCLSAKDELVKNIDQKENQLALKTEDLTKKEKELSLLVKEKKALELKAKEVRNDLNAKLASLNALLEAKTLETNNKLASLNQELSSKTTELTSLKQELTSKANKLAGLNSSIEKLSKDNSSLKKELSLKSGELEKIATNLNKTKSDLKIASSNIIEKDKKIDVLASKLNQKEENLRLIGSKLEKEEKRLAEKNLELAMLKQSHRTELEKVKSENYQRARLEKPKETKPIKKVAPDPYGLNAKFAALNKKIQERKAVSDLAKAKAKYIHIKHSPLVSSLGVSLDTYRARSKRVASKKQADRIQKGLVEIEKILREDIQLFKRLSGL